MWGQGRKTSAPPRSVSLVPREEKPVWFYYYFLDFQATGQKPDNATVPSISEISMISLPLSLFAVESCPATNQGKCLTFWSTYTRGVKPGKFPYHFPARSCWTNEPLGSPERKERSQKYTLNPKWKSHEGNSACHWVYSLGLSPQSCLLSSLSLRNSELAAGCLCDSRSISSHPTSAGVPRWSQGPWPPVHMSWVICSSWALPQKGGQSVAPLTALHSINSMRILSPRGHLVTRVWNTRIVPFLSLWSYWLKILCFMSLCPWSPRSRRKEGTIHWRDSGGGRGSYVWMNKEEGRGIQDVLESLPAELWFSHHWKMWELVRGVSTCSELWEHSTQADSELRSRAYPLKATYLLQEWTGAWPAHPPPSCSGSARRDCWATSLMAPTQPSSTLLFG